MLADDVYLASGSQMRPTHDNWYYDADGSESHDQRVAHSGEKARSYILRYSEHLACFALIPHRES